MAVMKEFEHNGNIDWRLNFTNIILIHKYDGVVSIKNFRSIILIVGMYKSFLIC